MDIPFNKPHITGKEIHYISQVISSCKLSGNGTFTKKCQDFFEYRYNFKKTLLTTSCTDALEMCAMLINIKEGDEVIVPSFTFVSTAIAFQREGAKIVFADSNSLNPNINVDIIESLITPKTKAIVVVHYAGIACDMDKIIQIADKYNIVIIEDAAQAIDSYYTNKDGVKKPLGSIGHLAAFSFHETKNIITGEGGMLVINDERYIKRSEIIWEKGTNRAEFFRGEVNKYGWVDKGSSFLPSELIAAFLWAQLEEIEDIQNVRSKIWNNYNDNLKKWTGINGIQLPFIPEYSTNNSHMFFMLCKNVDQRTKIMNYLKNFGILSVFHYQSLHKSTYYKQSNPLNCNLSESDKYTDTLLRLPLYYDMTNDDLKKVIDILHLSLE
jgi:dTDP-4-amino-4,6-dideoxygalactose transaminase